MKFHLCLITVSPLLGLLVAHGNSNRGKKEKKNDTNISLGILITEMDDWQFIGI